MVAAPPLILGVGLKISDRNNWGEPQQKIKFGGGPQILGGPMNPNDAMIIMLKDIFYVCQVLASYTQLILVDIIYETFQMCYYHQHACLLVCLSLLSQRWNFSSKVVGKIIAEGEAKKHLPRQCLGKFFADVIEQISVFVLAIPSPVSGNYFGNVVLFN